jgi:2-oxoglutarate ferredoxin oxidoreductase subunit alpha
VAGPSGTTFGERRVGDRAFMHCNEALAEAAIRAGCTFYAGYPITPHTEIMEYMAANLPAVGGSFVFAEQEVAGANMIYGAAAAGARCMTSSSSTAFDLFMEVMSTIATVELPSVWVNVSRGGPGFGNLGPSQGDYHQATRGGGHGGYRCIVLAPSSTQETVDLTMDAFHLADKWRNPVVILTDASLAQTKETVVFGEPHPTDDLPPKTWALTGNAGREPNKLSMDSLGPPAVQERLNQRLLEKWTAIAEQECRWEEVETDDADVLIVAFGIAARLAKHSIQVLRAEGLKVGMLRPITLWPFPADRIRELSERAEVVLDVELSHGQMVEDVRLAVEGRAPVDLLNRFGGMMPSPEEIETRVRALARRPAAALG